MYRYILAIALCWPVDAHAQQPVDPPWTPPSDVTYRTDWIMSEGVRMAAEIFAPKTPAEGKLPTIIMSHGWGGVARHLRPDAVVFARAGYLVVTFDYRGWGESESRLILVGDKLKRDDEKVIAEVTEVREVVDPIDQTTDILNAIHWTVAEDRCDSERIGLWGSSYSGGHVVYVAARDPRVKALVSQVGAMDSRWILNDPQYRADTLRQATARTRGEIGYPPPGTRYNNLTGAPIVEKLMRYAPIEDVDRSEQCAKLFIIAENEELFDNEEHAILAYKRATGAKKLVVIEGIKHYGIYLQKRKEAQQLALDWYDQHLKN